MAAGTFPPLDNQDVGKFRQGETFALTVKLQDANETPVDLTYAHAVWKLYDQRGVLVLTLDDQTHGGLVLGGVAGTITATISSIQTAELMGRYSHNLYITFLNGTVINPLSGTFVAMPANTDNL